jgi:hypothetical protein
MIVGVVVERRTAANPWVDHTWRALSVLAGQPEASPWTKLSDDGDTATFYVGTGEIALYRTETGNYRDNLASGAPLLWVALRPTGGDPPWELFGVTADPGEGEAWTVSGTDLVETVPMPETVRAWVEAFIAAHHVERPFFKRRRDRADPEVLARQAPRRRQSP